MFGLVHTGSSKSDLQLCIVCLFTCALTVFSFGQDAQPSQLHLGKKESRGVGGPGEDRNLPVYQFSPIHGV